jgi:hypothetical protein
MKVLFEFREVSQDWRPPFEKKMESKDVLVKEGETFGEDKEGQKIFRLLKVENRKALIEFSNQYSLKNYEQPKNHQVWVEDSDFVSFSALWTQNGVTKKLRIKDIFVE